MTATPVKTSSTYTQPAEAAAGCQPRPLRPPRFHAGQILNDADLNALVGWAGDRLALHRYRDGWGVVCGLRVAADTGGRRLVVAPGYAVDGCGRDIIVCTDECRRAEIDLGKVFDGLAADCAPPNGNFDFACYHNETRYLRVVDVFLHHQETGRPARDDNPCQPTRAAECYTLTWREGKLDDDPVLAHAEAWRDRARAVFERHFTAHVRSFVDLVFDRATAEQLAAFVEALRAACAAGGHEFPLAYLMSGGNGGGQGKYQQGDGEGKGEQPGEFDSLSACAFWVAFDCLLAAIGGGCAACDEAQGVPLARVWLQTHRADGRRDHRVLLVDNAPPFRRLLHADPFPAPLGGHNLAPTYGRRYNDAADALRAIGFTDVQRNTVPPLASVRGLLDWANGQFDAILRADHARPLDVLVWDGPLPFGQRVVGFLP